VFSVEFVLYRMCYRALHVTVVELVVPLPVDCVLSVECVLFRMCYRALHVTVVELVVLLRYLNPKP
jgi:hypothetical protein